MNCYSQQINNTFFFRLFPSTEISAQITLKTTLCTSLSWYNPHFSFRNPNPLSPNNLNLEKQRTPQSLTKNYLMTTLCEVPLLLSTPNLGFRISLRRYHVKTFSIFLQIVTYMTNAKSSLNRHGGTLWIPRGRGSQISGQSARVVGKGCQP